MSRAKNERVGDAPLKHPVDALMATLVAHPVPIDLAEIEKLATSQYGLESVSVTRLTGERDENFRLIDAEGTRYILKVANASEEAAWVDLTTAALVHVERVDPDLPCPRVVPTLSGSSECWYHDAGSNGSVSSAFGPRRAARLLTYVPGKSLHSASSHTRAQRVACGRIAARLGLALRDFTHPAARRPLIWDVRNVGKTVGLLHEVPDLVEKDTITTLIERIEMLLAMRSQQLRRQVIHNDLNDQNLLVDPDDENVIAGIIDFGDLVHTILVADIAIVATDLVIQARSSARDSIADVVMAYHEVTPLLPAELVVLNPLIAGRILTDVLIASWHRRRNPSGQHYADLTPSIVRSRVALAEQLLATDMPL
jgi:hydroxylysine kinase